MNAVHIYFVPESGEIHSCTNGTPLLISGLEIATINVPKGMAIVPDRRTQRIDTNTKQLISKSPEEIEAANQPESAQISDVLFLRSMEFTRTDPWVLPDRGLPDEVKAQWVAYRQALRDLTKDQDGNRRTAREMVEALPTSPDGYDLRNALKYHLMGRR